MKGTTISRSIVASRAGAWRLFGLGGVLIVVASAWALAPSPKPPMIDETQLSISSIAVGCEQKIRLSIHNPNWAAVRIVGCRGFGCGPSGCVYGIEPETFDIAPGKTKDVFVQFKSPPIPGPFEKEFIIYSATDTLNEHKLKVTGVAVAAKKDEAHHEVSKDTKETSGEKSDVSASKN